MELSFFYIADGRLYEYAGNGSRELVSGVLESYLSKVRS